MAKAARWFLEGLAVAAFAAGAFLLPWLWVKVFPPKGPYTQALSPRVGPRLPSPEPIIVGGRALSGTRLSPPTPLPGEKHVFVDLRGPQQTVTAYDGIREVARYVLLGSRLPPDEAGPCRVRGKSRRHWYSPAEHWLGSWMSLEPLDPAAGRAARQRGYSGFLAEPDGAYRLPTHLRLAPEDARELWEWAEVGTRVYLYRYRRQRAGFPALLARARVLAGD